MTCHVVDAQIRLRKSFVGRRTSTESTRAAGIGSVRRVRTGITRALPSRHESVTILEKTTVAAANAVEQSRRRTQLVVRAGCRGFGDASAVAQLTGRAGCCPHPCAVVADDWWDFPPRDGTRARVGDDAQFQYWRRRPLRLILVVVVVRVVLVIIVIIVVQGVRVAASAADYVRGDRPRRVDPRTKRIPRPRAGRGAVVGGLGLHPGTTRSPYAHSRRMQASSFFFPPPLVVVQTVGNT